MTFSWPFTSHFSFFRKSDAGAATAFPRPGTPIRRRAAAISRELATARLEQALSALKLWERCAQAMARDCRKIFAVPSFVIILLGEIIMAVGGSGAGYQIMYFEVRWLLLAGCYWLPKNKSITHLASI